MPVTGNNLSTYELSIRIFADGFSFLVTQTETGDLMHREDVREVSGEAAAQALLNTLSSPSLARYIYKEVRAIASTPATIVPLDEVSEDDYEAAYRLVFPQNDLSQCAVLSTPMPALGIAVLFTIPKAVHTALQQSYATLNLSCMHACLLGHAQEMEAKHPSSKPSLHAYILQDTLYLMALEDGKLLFANTFPTDNIQNTLYFLLSVWKEIGFDAKQHRCIVSGNRYLSAQLCEQVRHYILHVERVEMVDVALS